MSSSTPAGIVITDNNKRVIPATRRADGTLRKERRVREGFVPQEDIARYKNPWVEETTPPPQPKPEVPKKKSQTQKKNEKRNLKRREEREKEDIQRKLSELSINKDLESPADSAEKAVIITIEQLENTTKKIKALEKKIRQIERIKEKQARGESLNLEEKEKVNKLEQIQEELRRLKEGDEE